MAPRSAPSWMDPKDGSRYGWFRGWMFDLELVAVVAAAFPSGEDLRMDLIDAGYAAVLRITGRHRVALLMPMSWRRQDKDAPTATPWRASRGAAS